MSKTMFIYVVDHSGPGLSGDVYFWFAEVEEKAKTYKVIKLWDYYQDSHGQEMVRETNSIMALSSYRKNDHRVFLYLKDAKARAVDLVQRHIKHQEEKLNKNRSRLESWK